MGKQFVLTTNERGQVTFPKEVMNHCGLPSGGKLKVEFLPDGICKFSPIRPLPPTKTTQTSPSSSSSSAGATAEEE
jgi:bifunctional DNA-binding transcriptional regulator/antitoxin component of YhaV-PrlF toxin-antitoxin module